IKDVLARFPADAVRYLLLTSHYRSPISFSDAGLEQAEKRVEYCYETLRRLDDLGEGEEGDLFDPARVDGARDAFLEAMDDDFNTAAALGHLADLFRFANELAEKTAGVDKKKAARTL